MQAKQIVDQTLKTPNPIGGMMGASAEGRAAPGADLMRHKTLFAERSQSVSARRAPVSKPTAVAKARKAPSRMVEMAEREAFEDRAAGSLAMMDQADNLHPVTRA